MLGVTSRHDTPFLPRHSSPPANSSGFVTDDLLAALQNYFSITNELDKSSAYDQELDSEPYSADEFRMYEFKVRQCMKIVPHEWTSCPFAHPGEKAARRDPRRHAGAPCPEHRRLGRCSRGDTCPLSHGVFECWLHPDRYRTRVCRDGVACRRPVCFFAHDSTQLRSPPPAESRGLLSPPVGSPPVSPGGASVEEVLQELKKLQLGTSRVVPRLGALERRTAAIAPPAVAMEAAEGDEGAPDVGWVTELIN